MVSSVVALFGSLFGSLFHTRNICSSILHIFLLIMFSGGDCTLVALELVAG